MFNLESIKKCNKCKILDIVLNISSQVLMQVDISKILTSFYSQINTVFEAPLIAIGIYNHEAEHLDFWGISNTENSVLRGTLPITNQNFWSVRCFCHNEEIIISNLEKTQEMLFSRLLFNVEDNKRKSFMYLPLISKNIPIGVLTLQSFTPHAFEKYHIDLVRTIANYISIAIENSTYVQLINNQSNDLKAIIENMEEIIVTRTDKINQQNILLEKQSQLLTKKNKELEILSIVAKETENAIMIMDSLGNIIWVNDFFTKIYAYNLVDFIHVRGSNIISTSFNPNIKAILKECINTKSAVTYDALNIKQNGEKIWTQTSLTPILDEFGNIKNLVTIDSDISKIKQAENEIREKSNEILQSIQYASRIQRAAFPSIEYIKSVIPHNFILWKPLDIVSGDFYWIKKIQNKTIIVLGDCTGHGVPGALLSMLGCSFLEDIISEYSNQNAAQILDTLQLYFKLRFRQQVMGSQMADGMDIAICILDSITHKLDFAAANNELIYIRNNTLYELKGNKLCIGLQNTRSSDFTNFAIPIEQNDIFYLFSDGFHSQFGGENGKKYMKSKLLEKFREINSFSFEKQEQFLIKEIDMWKGNTYEQTDDITIIGFQFDLFT